MRRLQPNRCMTCLRLDKSILIDILPITCSITYHTPVVQRVNDRLLMVVWHGCLLILLKLNGYDWAKGFSHARFSGCYSLSSGANVGSEGMGLGVGIAGVRVVGARVGELRQWLPHLTQVGYVLYRIYPVYTHVKKECISFTPALPALKKMFQSSQHLGNGCPV